MASTLTTGERVRINEASLKESGYILYRTTFIFGDYLAYRRGESGNKSYRFIEETTGKVFTTESLLVELIKNWCPQDREGVRYYLDSMVKDFAKMICGD